MDAEALVSEHDFQQRIIRLAKEFGWLVNRTYRAQLQDGSWRTTTTGIGFPDLILVHPVWARIVVLEVKSAKGKVEPAQRRWIGAFQRVAENAPGVVSSFVVYPHDFPAVSRLLTRRHPN